MTFKISRNTKIGIVLVITSAIFIWGINFLKGIDIFKKENNYYAIYNKVDGLVVSSSVQINGFDVGQVMDIYFHEDNSGRLVVNFAIGSEYKLPIHSTARIISSDIMGTKAIQLIYGDSVNCHQHGDTLIASIEESLKDQVSIQMLPLKTKAEDLMQEIEEAIVIVKLLFNEKTRENLEKSFESIKQTIQSLETSSYRLDTLMLNEKRKLSRIFTNIESITTNLNNSNAELTNILNNFSNISDSLAKSQIKNTIDQAHAALYEINKIIERINKGEGSIGLLLNNDTLYYNLENATYNLDKLLEDLRVNPKRYVHFSLFNMGKKAYKADENLNNKEDKKDNVIYKIQIKTSNIQIPLSPENFFELKNVEEHIDNEIYKYTVGNKKSVEKILELFEEIKIKYPDSFILVFKNGDKYPLKLNDN
ncbi:MAG: MCE family protein [Bacteroidales bacterium]|nr:MCE family protein [Bacteroidales bacterium]